MRGMAKALTVAAVLTISAGAFGAIAHTSFEVPASVGGQYTDSGDAGLDHALADNPGEPWVNYAASGGEMGYSAHYYNTRSDVGLTDGDYFGVTDYAGTVGAYTDGAQGYQMQDCDGKVVLSFDVVDLSTSPVAGVSLDLFVQETGWESDDAITVSLEAPGLGSQVLLDTTGSDIDDLLIEGFWMNLGADLSGATSAALSISLESNSANEAIFIDNVQFTPEPATLGLLVVGGLFMARRRR